MYILRFEVKQHVSALYGHHQVFPLRFRYLYSETLRKTPDDGHIRPKHVVLLQILVYTSFI